jgi:hypothetical protein
LARDGWCGLQLSQPSPRLQTVPFHASTRWSGLMKNVVLWLLGVPISVLIILNLMGVL